MVSPFDFSHALPSSTIDPRQSTTVPNVSKTRAFTEGTCALAASIPAKAIAADLTIYLRVILGLPHMIMRNLIGGFSLFAAGVAVGSFPMQPGFAQQNQNPGLRLNHVGIYVKDYDESMRFYTKTMGGVVPKTETNS